MRFTIKLKLGLAFGLLILLSCGSAAFGILGVRDINTVRNAMIEGPVHQDDYANDLSSAFDGIALGRMAEDPGFQRRLFRHQRPYRGIGRQRPEGTGDGAFHDRGS